MADKPGLHPSGGPLMTKQSMALESDVNAIVARHIAHAIPFVEDGRATYGDFTDISDYHSALNRVMEAQDQFSMLPAHVREHCSNDPGEFLKMVYDPARRAELVDLGLVEAQIPAASEAPPAPIVGAPGGTVAGT